MHSSGSWKIFLAKEVRERRISSPLVVVYRRLAAQAAYSVVSGRVHDCRPQLSEICGQLGVLAYCISVTRLSWGYDGLGDA